MNRAKWIKEANGMKRGEKGEGREGGRSGELYQRHPHIALGQWLFRVMNNSIA